MEHCCVCAGRTILNRLCWNSLGFISYDFRFIYLFIYFLEECFLSHLSCCARVIFLLLFLTWFFFFIKFFSLVCAHFYSSQPGPSARWFPRLPQRRRGSTRVDARHTPRRDQVGRTMGRPAWSHWTMERGLGHHHKRKRIFQLFFFLWFYFFSQFYFATFSTHWRVWAYKSSSQ